MSSLVYSLLFCKVLICYVTVSADSVQLPKVEAPHSIRTRSAAPSPWQHCFVVDARLVDKTAVTLCARECVFLQITCSSSIRNSVLQSVELVVVQGHILGAHNDARVVDFEGF